MPRPARIALVAALSLCAAGAVHAQTLGPDFDDFYLLQDLGAVPGVPPNYGFVIFKRDDPGILLIGGRANEPSGLIYQVWQGRVHRPEVLRSLGRHEPGHLANADGHRRSLRELSL